MPLDQAQVDALAKRKGLTIHRHRLTYGKGRVRIECVTCGKATKFLANEAEARESIKQLGHA